MKLKFLSLLLFVSFSSHSSNISRIICKPSNSNDTATSAIWPQPYLLMINYALILELTLEMHVLPMVKKQRGLLNQ